MCRAAVDCEELKSRDMTKFKPFNNVLDFAISREIEAQVFYLKLAAVTQEQVLKEMFLKLARDEAEHKLRFEIEYDLMTF
jgi:rubrerythrin